MKIGIIGTYPPRRCGIGTFTQNLLQAILRSSATEPASVRPFVVAIDDGEHYDYPKRVECTIQQDRLDDYLRAAKHLNRHADVCLLQHEYGIFGGEHGVYILNLLEQLRIPVVTTLHTVLARPDFVQVHIVRAIGRLSAQVVVMSRKAVEFLVDVYQIPRSKISIIEHGVPEPVDRSRESLRRRLGFEGRRVLFTFGLLGRGKGIETVLHALPAIVERHPDSLYCVLGKTHPNVMRQEGESYRESLRAIAAQYGLENHLMLIDAFVEEQELQEYLQAIDLYVVPYLSEAQITSGTLSYAVGAGAAVVSTPFWHATELLGGERGRLFPFKDAGRLSETILDLFDHDDQLEALRRRAGDYGKTLTWPRKGGEYRQLLEKVNRQRRQPRRRRANYSDLPPLNLRHLRTLTDSTGIIQHAKFSVPNYFEGYCLDDNARALIVATQAVKVEQSALAERLIPTYLAYLFFVQREDGWFRNFLSYDRRFLDDRGSDDAFGRAIWALGYFLANGEGEGHLQLARLMFDRAATHLTAVRSPRAVANIILGLGHYLRRYPDDENVLNLLRDRARWLASEFDQCRRGDWQWYEKVLSYDNGLLPLAMFTATEFLSDSEIAETAHCTLAFLEKLVLQESHLRLLGCREPLCEGAEPYYFDQQPLDAMAMVLLYLQIYRLTGEEEHRRKALLCFEWFLGRNDLWTPLYNPQNGGCYDGLEEHGINRNQGAESTLAFLLSLLALQELRLEETGEPDTTNNLLVQVANGRK